MPNARLERARRGELRLEEFTAYGDAADALIAAEEATTRHARIVAAWQAAGSPVDPQHAAADDLIAAHQEATYYRTKLTKLIGSPAADVERAVARHFPRQGRCIVVVHARLAQLERRPLRLPEALQPKPPEAVGTHSERPKRRRRGSARITPERAAERATVIQVGSSPGLVDGDQYVLAVA